MAGVLSEQERGRLLGIAVSAIAWELVEDETDTVDRGVSEAHFQDAVRRAQMILPTLLPTVPAPPRPIGDVRVALHAALARTGVLRFLGDRFALADAILREFTVTPKPTNDTEGEKPCPSENL